MNLISSIFLGILQGLTEFLPVSSSGHLVIVQNLIPGFTQDGVLFDVFLHAGTVLAVLYYFRKTLLKLTPKYLFLLLIGTIPAGLVGVFLGSSIENLFNGVYIVGFALLFTAVLNFLTDRAKTGSKEISIKKTILIGMAQALAIIPGISRSGSTIFAGTSLGIKRKEAAQFSFLLSVPAIVGANAIQFLKYGSEVTGNILFYSVGFIAAFISGVIAINFVLKFLLAGRFKLFAYYCVVLGVLVLTIL
ncbi:undecaprenyl-diphosphate phosphatase [Patescibacteria group bacterium]|nr:undecaprenyl-diphosphate phosphatase [Patescibacteria group bacterium]MBU0776878.1 undecaprenyl-diphosphate phosphatase [Patescibacteria group bacterium]MBU0846243.1 undecaprenyl-diphosphate phosphatase [Patescibacteria group bacterium]MBU0922590.1 undecaprenyl-diphosphate phosphatase [Patescibacteria group bacterium]MBU1066641.1 undecaprenyl-diphosphate phosphatase [Patescibacteria group bacterium]